MLIVLMFTQTISARDMDPEMMQEMIALGRPGPEHEQLKFFEGDGNTRPVLQTLNKFKCIVFPGGSLDSRNKRALRFWRLVSHSPSASSNKCFSSYVFPILKPKVL